MPTPEAWKAQLGPRTTRIRTQDSLVLGPVAIAAAPRRLGYLVVSLGYERNARFLPFYEFCNPHPGVSGDSWVRGLSLTKCRAEEEPSSLARTYVPRVRPILKPQKG